MKNDVALTILEQLGGNKFVAMTGVKNIIADGNMLRMKLPKNKSKANYLEITYEPTDTYTLKFFKYTEAKYNIKKGTFKDEVNEVKRILIDVYFDQLQEMFTLITGMDTHL